MDTTTVEKRAGAPEHAPVPRAEERRDEEPAQIPFAGAQPAVLDARTLLALQATIGNGAVARLMESRTAGPRPPASEHPAPAPALKVAAPAVRPPEIGHPAPAIAQAATPAIAETAPAAPPVGETEVAAAPVIEAAPAEVGPEPAGPPGPAEDELDRIDRGLSAGPTDRVSGPSVEPAVEPAAQEQEKPEAGSPSPAMKETGSPEGAGAADDDLLWPPELEAEAEAAPEVEPETQALRPEATEPQQLEKAPAAPRAAAAPETGAETPDLVAQDTLTELDSSVGEGGADIAPSGGGGGGSPIPEKPPVPVPDLSAAEPSSALTRAGALPPAMLAAALGGVSAAIGRTAAQEQSALASQPPERDRHFGAPSTVEGPASGRVLAARADGPHKIHNVPEGSEVQVVPPEALAQTSLAAAVHAVRPGLNGDGGAQLSAGDSQKIAAAIGNLPVRDAGLSVSPGPLPRLALEGSADPARMRQQRQHLEDGVAAAHIEGQHEAAQPMGEDEIYPVGQPEQLRADVASAAPAAAPDGATPPVAAEGGGGPGGADDPASLVAQQERGSEIQAAVAQSAAAMAAHRQEYSQRTAAERARADTEMGQLEVAGTGEQAAERAAAMKEVQAHRASWSQEQGQLAELAAGEAGQATNTATQTVTREHSQAQQEAAAHYQEGQREADAARRQGEREAAAEKQRAQSQGSGGFFGWVASAAHAAFDAVKQAVQGVFERARVLVNAAIDRARQLATAVLEGARQAIVAAITVAASALVAIGGRVLAAFPVLRDRFRNAILAVVTRAEAAVNAMANRLRQSVQAALNLLGKGLSGLIGLYEAGLRAAVEVAGAVVREAIQAARSAINALGTLAELVADIARNPVQWIQNLAAGAMDGVRNHLWPGLLNAVKGWFTDKVEGMIGMGTAVWSLLRRGGITLAEVGHFAWEAIKSMIPQTLISILIEKVVAFLVPAAGMALVIVQAIQAAWGSLGKILQAWDGFVAFLKRVRFGNAGPAFGGMVMAGVVAVIDFLSNFLLMRLQNRLKGVGEKLKALAKRIGSRLTAIARRVAGAGEAAGGAIASGLKTARRGAATVGSYVVAGARALGGTLRRGASRASSSVRRRVAAGAARIRLLKQRGRLGPSEESLQKPPPESIEGAAAAAAKSPEEALRYLIGAEKYDAHKGYIQALKSGHPELRGIPDEELIALRGYTSDDYAMLNQALRRGDPDELARHKPYIERAVAGLKEMPPYKGTVFRGVRDLTPDQLARYVPGEVVIEPAFTSSSVAAEQAFAGKALLVIESETGKSVALVSRYPYEKEVLFPPGTRFKVLEVDQSRPDVIRIFMKEVPG